MELWWRRGLRWYTYIQRGIRAIDTTTDDLAIVDEDAADGRFVGQESQFGHFDGPAHEVFMVLAVGDRSEHHIASVTCP